MVGALFAAVDGGARLWDDRGFWRAHAVRGFYGWRPTLRVLVAALVVSVGIVLVPIAVVAAGLVVFPIDFVLKIIGIEASGGLVSQYVGFAERAFASTALPTWLPRLVLIVMGVTAGILLATSRSSGEDRRGQGPFWWRVVRAPLSAHSIVSHSWSVMWDLVRGAAQLREPEPAELGRRYVEMLSENLGQPGFRELVIGVHDVDGHRDLVFALVGADRRRDLMRRSTPEEIEARQAEVQDLGGVAGQHLTDALSGALAIPQLTEFHTIRFAPESHWRGEHHRIADRPSSLTRILEELARLDVTQILLVSASPDAAGPHTLKPVRLDALGRFGEYLQSSESAMVRDLAAQREEGRPRIFTIRPAHNPIGPFDFGGAFDARSHRHQTLDELLSRGYEDAYRQFIEPVVGASGDRVGQKKIRS